MSTIETLKVGDVVKPKPNYCTKSIFPIPSGRVIAVVRYGESCAVYVDGDKRAFISDVFDVVEDQ